MRILAAGIVLLLAVSAGAASAQVRGQTLRPDAEEIIWAAIEAYALRPTTRAHLGSAGTLVIAGHTSEFEYTAVRRRAPLTRGARHDFDFVPHALDDLAARSGLSIVGCDTLTEGHSLCAVPQPWIWLVVSHPAVEGDRAITVLEERQLDTAPGLRPYPLADMFDVTLVREQGIWRVVEVIPDNRPDQ